jgi:hypothetical protein
MEAVDDYFVIENVHLVAQQLFDLTGDLSGLADRDEQFRLAAGRGMNLPIVVADRILVSGTSPGGKVIASMQLSSNFFPVLSLELFKLIERDLTYPE